MVRPLISDAAMRGMYDTMQRMRIAKRTPGLTGGLSRAKYTALQAEPESLLAALLSQVHRRDTLLTEGANGLLLTALQAVFKADATPVLHVCEGTPEDCGAVAAGMAIAAADRLLAKGVPLTGGSPRPVIIALLSRLPSVNGTFRLIEENGLPVLLIAGGEPDSRADAQRRLLSTKVPVMPVDRADAVAVCRVVQECLLRARNGWGGAVIHATAMQGLSDPMLLLREHLRTRGLLTATSPA